MLYTKEINYSKAYVELYEIIKRLPKKQLNNIPTNLIENIKKLRNSEYNWIYNEKKSVCEQELMIETKALIVELYENFLCAEDRKDTWKNYNRICLNFIENEKHKNFNSNFLFESNNIFNNSDKQQETIKTKTTECSNAVLIEYKESVFTKFKTFIFKILNRRNS